MRNDRQAYLALIPRESDAAKVDKIMRSDLPYALRLAAVNAAGKDKGKVWR